MLILMALEFVWSELGKGMKYPLQIFGKCIFVILANYFWTKGVEQEKPPLLCIFQRDAPILKNSFRYEVIKGIRR